MPTLKQFLKEITKQGSCWMQDFEPDIIQAVTLWVTQKETDDFGGEMTATEFKLELLEELNHVP